MPNTYYYGARNVQTFDEVEDEAMISSVRVGMRFDKSIYEGLKDIHNNPTEGNARIRYWTKNMYEAARPSRDNFYEDLCHIHP